MKANATTCSTACRSEAYRQRQGIAKPDFLTNSKPMHATNEQRDALSEDDKIRVRTLKMELDNYTKIHDGLLLKHKETHRILENYRIKGYLPDVYLSFFSDMENPPQRPTPARYEHPLTYHGTIVEIDESKLRKRHTLKKSIDDEEKTKIEYEKVKNYIDANFDKSLKISDYIENSHLKSVINVISKITPKKHPEYPLPIRYYKTVEIFNETAYNKELEELKASNEKEKARKKEVEEENRRREQANQAEKRRYESEEKLYEEYREFTKMNAMNETKDDGTILGARELKDWNAKLQDMLKDSLSHIKRIKNELAEIYPELPKNQTPDGANLPLNTASMAYVMPDRKRAELTTGADLVKTKFKTYQFNAEWENLLGKPSRPFSAMVFGDAKAGKSFFCFSMAQYLTLFGDVLYIACEEGLSETTKRKIEATEAYDVVINGASTIEDIIQALDQDKYQFCFIDSVSHARMNVEDFQELKQRFPKTSFIAILQTTKNNQFKGEKEWLHDAGTILELTKTATNATKVECRGRFGTGDKLITW